MAVDATVLLCTYNRAGLLGQALDSLARMRASGAYRWEVLVVDNNSTDATRRVVENRQSVFPVPLRYLVEPRQGKSYALNTGIDASRASVIVFGDDDQRFADGWVDEACRPLLEPRGLDYTGGPVWPLWEAPPPTWLDLNLGELRAPVGVFDYGTEPFVFEERGRLAGGGNMAVSRSLFDRIGGFSVSLGRTGQSLLGQEQADFFHRSRAAGARGLYVPSMQVYHHVPRERMTRSYFRRWWYWRGISRARYDRLHRLTDDGVDLGKVPRILGVPRFIFGTALRHARQWLASWAGGTPAVRFVHELQLWYSAGYVRETLTSRQRRAPASTTTSALTLAEHSQRSQR
jgi:glycosyltransferase involved in cell wall biosynthesis